MNTPTTIGTITIEIKLHDASILDRFLSAIAAVRDKLPECGHPVFTANQPPPPKPAPAKPAAAPSAKPPARPYLKRRRKERSSPLFKALHKLLADGTPRHIDAIIAALPAAVATGENLRQRVNVCLGTNRQAFSRTARATYTLAATPIHPGAALVKADPAKLTDEQLAERLRYAKSQCTRDRAARLEYITRNANKGGK